MAVPWGGLHRWLGLATVVVFLATGLYMRWREPPVAELEMGLRMLFRSRHIYILMAGLVNLGLGLHLVPPAGRGPRRLPSLGSALLALAPPLAVAGFFHEGEVLAVPGPLAALAIYALFGGTLLHGLAAVVTWHARGRGQ